MKFEYLEKLIGHYFQPNHVNKTVINLNQLPTELAKRTGTIINQDRLQTAMEWLMRPVIQYSKADIDTSLVVELPPLEHGYSYVLNGVVVPYFKRCVSFHKNATGFNKAYLALFQDLEIYKDGQLFLSVYEKIAKCADNAAPEFWKKLKRTNSLKDLSGKITWKHKDDTGTMFDYSVPVLLTVHILEADAIPIKTTWNVSNVYRKVALWIDVRRKRTTKQNSLLEKTVGLIQQDRDLNQISKL
jgi:hypothetical protein